MSFSRFKGYIYDLDGVVWLGTDPVPGVADAINGIRSKDRKIRFLTNNASQHRNRQCEKLRSMGVEADPSEVITSASAAAETLRGRFGKLNVFVMGTDDLKAEMEDAGHTVVFDRADWVVVGFDRGFNYEKLMHAFRNVHVHGARFLACNENALYPSEHGLVPGAGASVAALAYCAGMQPELIIGKPHRPIFDIALSSIGLPPGECAMVADLLELDIKGAQACGMGTIFVLSGIDTEADIETTGIKPEFVFPSAAAIAW